MVAPIASLKMASRTALMSSKTSPEGGLRRAVGLVAALNLTYFGVEFAVALAIGSVSLFADSIDFVTCAC
jgi:Co/Zn/Cd efflux system component